MNKLQKKIIILTTSRSVPNEAAIITQFFDEGLSYLHLKKHGQPKEKIIALIKQIPSKYHPKIIIHHNYELVKSYNLGGIHVTREKRKSLFFKLFQLRYYKSKVPNLILTTSVHRVRSARKLPRFYTYILFGSIFDSIDNHKSNGYEDKSRLFYFLSNTTRDIVAMGGINESNIEELKKNSARSIALHTVIWSAANPVEKFKEIRDIWLSNGAGNSH